MDGAYPMVGAVRLAPDGALHAALARGLVVDPLILQRLGLHEGDKVRLGEAQFPVAAALTYEPDRGSALSIMGPPVLMRADALAHTGLIQPGSLVTYEWRVLLRPGADPRAFTAALRQAFPQTGWRISDRTRAEPGVNRAIDQTSLFLVLVGLSALLVGGIGVATGVHAWLDGRARTIAILRCLGADARLILVIFMIQVLGLCGAGILLGVAIAAALPAAGLALFGDLLPLPAKIGFLSGTASAGGVVRIADRGGIRLVAAGARGADSRRGVVPRCVRAGWAHRAAAYYD